MPDRHLEATMAGVEYINNMARRDAVTNPAGIDCLVETSLAIQRAKVDLPFGGEKITAFKAAISATNLVVAIQELDT